MSLLFNPRARAVTDFKDQACFNFTPAVTTCSDFGDKKIKFASVSIVCPSINHEVMRQDAMISVI